MPNITIKDYNEKNEFLSKYYKELSPLEFYSSIFEPSTIETEGAPYGDGNGKPNPIVSIKRYRYDKLGSPIIKYSKDGTKSFHTYFMENNIMFNNYKVLKKTKNEEFAICGLYTSWGKNAGSAHAFSLYGYCIDLDGVRRRELENLFYKFDNDILPVPTYVINSGNGVHIYYIFESPVPLLPGYKKALHNIKKGLTMMLWDRDTTTYPLAETQYQGIFQRFRMVGSHTKFAKGKKQSKYIVRAFETGKKVDLTYLNRFVAEWSYSKKYAVTNLTRDYASLSEERLSIEEAKELYPDWYDKIKRGQILRWYASPSLYYWWLNQIKENPKVREGVRFYNVSILFVYAMKCGIPYDAVYDDAVELIDYLDSKTQRSKNPFTLEDVEAASLMYEERWVKMSWSFIKERSGLDNIESSTKRNGQKQEWHLQDIRAKKVNMKKRGQPFKHPEGRPNKLDIIVDYLKSNPTASKNQIIRDTGLDKKTVYKWYDEAIAKLEQDKL